MSERAPAAAGTYYPEAPKHCRHEVEKHLSVSADLPVPEATAVRLAIGGIAPHAGWSCSGAVAAAVVKILATSPQVETFVIFGAVHRPKGSPAAICSSGSWRTPLGVTEIDEPLALAVIDATPLAIADEDAHGPEHSIEVEVPFVQYLAPAVRLLPIMVPPSDSAHQVGRVVAEQAQSLGRHVVFLGSTDLTHYGPGYDFTPQGVGPEALQWAKEVNDRRMLDLLLRLEGKKVVQEARANRNACGSGAIAATLGASKAMGASAAQLIRHTTSNEVLRNRFGETNDAVGYAGVVFGK